MGINLTKMRKTIAENFQTLLREIKENQNKWAIYQLHINSPQIYIMINIFSLKMPIDYFVAISKLGLNSI